MALLAACGLAMSLTGCGGPEDAGAPQRAPSDSTAGTPSARLDSARTEATTDEEAVPRPTGFADRAPTLRFERLGLEEGLAEATVFDLLQDRQGFMWFGTVDGLYRYDGHDFTVYKATPFDTTSISEGYIFDIAEAQNGDLWLATTGGGGLNRMDRATGTFSQYRHDPADPSSLSSNDTCGALEGRNGDLWVGTRGAGLNRMRAGEDGRFTHYRHDPEDTATITSDRVCSIEEDAAGHIWVGSGNGINRIDTETDEVTRFLYSTGPRVRGVPRQIPSQYHPPDEPGVVWLVGNGLVRLDSETGTFERFLVVPNEDGYNHLNSLNSVVPDPSAPGVLWVGGGGGVAIARFDARTREFVRYPPDAGDPNSLSSGQIRSVVADRSGTIWVGTNDKGLSRFNPEAVHFSHLRHDPEDAQSLAPGGVYALYEDREGTLWVRTDRAGVSSLTQFDAATGRVTRHRHDPNDPSTMQPYIRGFAEDGAGGFWLAGHSGFDRLDRRTGRATRVRHEPADENRDRNSMLAVLPSPSDPAVLWVGSQGGLDRFDTRTGTFTHVPLAVDSADVTPVQALAFDARGILWAGTARGLVRIDPAGGASLASAYDPRDPTTISSHRIYQITERAGEPGILWLATLGGGLNRFDTRTGIARHYTEADGLPSDLLSTVIEDESGTLWMSTSRGIGTFDPETETFRTYGLEDGLIALGYNWGAVAKGAGGVLSFGSSEGVTAFLPERLRTNTVPPQVALTGLRIANESVAVGPGSPLSRPLSETETITLAHHQNDVAFDYVALHFAHAAQNQYAYQLEGYAPGWVQAGTERTATFTNLPPGRYTFRMKAANADGVWNEVGASVGLVITPPWWRTGWAYLGYALCFGVGVFAVDRVQRRRVVEGERRRTASREIQLRADLAEERTQYLEALDQTKSRFFANISHEFRTPLTLLLGPLQQALGGDQPPEDLAQQVPVMHRNAGRLLRLVGQLLDLAKLEAGGMDLQPRRVELVAFVRDLVVAFAPLAERDGLTLLFDTQEAALWGAADLDKLEKIVTNLLSNAVKFTMRGGKIRVGLRATYDRAGVVLTVADTGQGIPADELPRVFDRFHQVDSATTREHEGTGLGLALVKELVELHQGTIDVKSERGFGATFTVRLPVHGVAVGTVPSTPDPGPRGPLSAAGLESLSLEARSPRPERAADGARAAEATVLVVEDNADVRAYVCTHLAAHHRILQADDGEAGLAMIRRHRPDLVLSDVMMPKLDGYALCHAVKADEALRHIPVILLTAKAEEADRIYGLEGGADDYLTKPFSIRELEVRVANLILSRAHLRTAYSGMVQMPLADGVIPSGEEAFMQRVLEVMNQHLGDSTYSTDRLAEGVHLSRRQVERRVKALTAQSPSKLMLQMRLERAAQILDARPGSIAEVAYAVGFKSPSHFSVAFRKVYGHTPTEHVSDTP